MSSAVVVHTTPPLTPLPASDSTSIRLLGTLRLGGVSPAVTTADWSANGKPFITLDNIAIHERYISSVPGWSDPDAGLSAADAADSVEWKAFIDGLVTDLVNHTMYSLPPNHPYLAGAQLASCPFPLNHYVPHRLRSINKARLQQVGLWGLGGGAEADDPEAQRKKLEDTIVVAPGGTKTERAWSGWRSGRETAERQRKFGEEAVRQRARAAFDPLARKIGSNRYFYGSKPTSFDLALFSQLTLVLSVSWPNPLLADLLRDSYPTLVAHHDRVLKKLYPGGWSTLPRAAEPPKPTLLDSIRLSLPSWMGGSADLPEIEKQEADIHPTEKDSQRRLKKGRYLWFLGAGAAFISYIVASGLIEIQFGDDEDEEYEEGEWIYEDDVDDPLAGFVADD